MKKISWYRDERPNPKVKDWNGPGSYRDDLRKDQAEENGFGSDYNIQCHEHEESKGPLNRPL